MSIEISEWLIIFTYFNLIYTQSNAVQFHHISTGVKEQESPTDEVLIEEARLHVAIIQMVSIVHIICF